MPLASEYEQTDMFEEPNEGDLVQVSPGRFIAKGGKPPEQIIAEVFHHSDSTFGIRPMNGGRYVRLSKRTVKMFGVRRPTTIVRLGIAGFVNVTRPAPGVYLLDVDSWCEHLRNTQENPDFWDKDGENFKTYMFKNGRWVE